MRTLGFILLLWCLPSAAIIATALVRPIGRAWLAKRWHLHEVFHGHHVGQAS